MFDKSGLYWIFIFREEDEDEVVIIDFDGNLVEKFVEFFESKEGGEEVSNLFFFIGFIMKCLRKILFCLFFWFL